MSTQAPAKVSFPGLDGLRFFCFLAVFLYHSFFTPNPALRDTETWKMARRLVINLHLGVNCFFVLSGFLITYLLLEEKTATGRVHVLHFYIRRILRIWPLYYACLGLGFVVFPWFKRAVGLVPGETGSVPAYLLFLGNFDQLFNGLPEAPVLQVLWSVAIEEQFYLVWPLLIALTRRERMAWLLGAIVAGSLLFRAATFSTRPAFLGLHTIAVISDMGIGGFAAFVASTSPRFVAGIARLPRSAIAAWYAALGAVLLFRGALFGVPFLVPVERLVTGCLFAGIILEQNYASHSLFKFAWSPRLTRLGRYTYAMYCLHTVVIVLVLYGTARLQLDRSLWQVLLLHPILGLGLTVAVSIISYRTLEAPFLRLKKDFQYVSRD